MTNGPKQKTDQNQPMIYQIRLEGHLGNHWTGWFEGMTITLDMNGDTYLTGPVVDQAALFGLLKKACDLGLTLVSIHRLEFGKPELSADNF